MIRVLLADDQVLLRNSLEYILNKDSDIEVVAVASDGNEVMKLLIKEQIDVVLLDIVMPEKDGIETVKDIKDLYPEIKVLMLTTFENIENIMESFICGANGYVIKDIAPDELVLAVKCVEKGLNVVHESVHEMMIKSFAKEYNNRYTIEETGEEIFITNTEKEIIKLVAQGKNNKEIAQIMNFAEGTIRNKITRLLDKLDLRDRVQIAIFALENSLL
jgi:DNA-binding NarL/FixJ family response regulator